MADEYRSNQEFDKTEEAMPRYREVGGWLSLLCFGLTVCTPLATIVSLAASYSECSRHFDQYPGLLVVFVIDTILSFGLVAFSIYAGIGLWCIRPGAVQTAKRYLLCLLGYHAIATILPFTAGLPSAGNQAMIAEVAKGTTKGVLFFTIWYWYLAKSKRVRNTYGDDDSLCFGGTDVPWTPAKTDEDIRQPALLMDERDKNAHLDKSAAGETTPSHNAANGREEFIKPAWLDQPLRQNNPPSDFSSSATETHVRHEWYVIRAGKELGPFSFTELIAMAVAREIEADELVKKAEGLWTKARDFDFLQRQFLLRDSREKATQERLDKLGRFHGIWLSKEALVIGGGVLLFIVAFAAIRAITKPTNTAHPVFIAKANDDADQRQAQTDTPNLDALLQLPEAQPSAAAFSGRGSAWLFKGDYDKAIVNFDDAIRLNPNDANDYARRGLAWELKKCYDRAIRDRETIIWSTSVMTRHYGVVPFSVENSWS